MNDFGLVQFFQSLEQVESHLPHLLFLKSSSFFMVPFDLALNLEQCYFKVAFICVLHHHAEHGGGLVVKRLPVLDDIGSHDGSQDTDLI